MPDINKATAAVEEYDKLYCHYAWSRNWDNLYDEYEQLSRFLQAIFVDDTYRDIGSMHFQEVNHLILDNILEKVRDNPEDWKKFMVML